MFDGEYLAEVAGWDGESCFITASGLLDWLSINEGNWSIPPELSGLPLASLQLLNVLFRCVEGFGVCKYQSGDFFFLSGLDLKDGLFQGTGSSRSVRSSHLSLLLL